MTDHDIDDVDAHVEIDVPPSVSPLRRTRRGLWIAVAVAVPVALLITVLATREPAQTRIGNSPLLGKQAPAVEARTVDDEPFRLSDTRGRWVLVNFFATWCVPCRLEHGDLIQISQRGDAAVVGVVYSDSVQAVKEFLAQEGGDWPMLTDAGGRIALDFGVAGVPESYLIGPDGRIAAKILGGIRAVDFDRLLAEARVGGR
ncbi:MAG: TlpA family protein disulfide reductase [Actinomycetota bacterium]|nr:TlpA family protein disulfide reductase [Actinomycetota bacterium]